MTLTPKAWQQLVTAIEAIPNTPTWLGDQLRLSWEEILSLPELDTAGYGQQALPTIKDKVINEDYLAFLHDQIRVNTRGVQWATVLANRVDALKSYSGQELLTVTFYRKPNLTIAYFVPETFDLIYLEII